MLKLLFYLHGDYSDSIMESTAAAAPTSTIVEISPQHQTQDSKNIGMALKVSLDMQSLVPPETDPEALVRRNISVVPQIFLLAIYIT